MSKISLILPVFNVGEYLYQSLSCLIHQTHKDIEIICVDDGSTDNSVEIITNFKAADSRIRLVQIKHAYAGGARNAGLQISTGEYVMFLDPDDYFDIRMCEILHERISKENVEMIITGVFNDYGKKIVYQGPSLNNEINDFYDEKIITPNDIKEGLFYFLVYPYNKIYKREFLIKNNLKFDEIANTNDATFALESYIAASRILILNKAYYYYRKFRPGNTRAIKGKRLDCVIEAYQNSFDKCKKYQNFTICENGFHAVIIVSLIFHITSYCLKYDPDKEFYYKFVQQYIRENFEENTEVRETLKEFNFSAFCFAKIIVENEFEEFVRLRKKEGLLKIIVKTTSEELRCLGIPLKKYIVNPRKEKHRLLGFSYKVVEKDVNKKTYRYFGIPFFSSSSISRGVKRYFDFLFNRLGAFDDDEELIVILNDHIGETFLICSHIKDLLNKENSRRIIFVVNSLAQKEIVELFVPECHISNIIHIPVSNNLRKQVSRYISLNDGLVMGRKVLQFMPDEFWHTEEVENSHYYELICKYLDINETDNQTIVPNFSDETKDSLNKKIEISELKEKFVFVSPEANTVSEISKEFWVELVGKIRELGYDVYLNVTKSENVIPGAKIFSTTVKEGVLLASRAAFVIALRSGFSEVLTSVKVPSVIVYNGGNRMLRNSIKKIPKLDFDELYEIDYLEDSDLCSSIMSLLSKNWR